MEYLSAAQTAAKWGVSARIVQRYCAKGRIPGAKRLGREWLIPAGAEKPPDPRGEPARQGPPGAKARGDRCLLPVLYIHGGDIDAAFNACQNDAERQLLNTNIAFMRGDAEKARKLALEVYNETGDVRLRLGGGLMLALCAMCGGSAAAWKETVAALSDMAVPKSMVMDKEFTMAAINAGLHGMKGYPAWLEAGDFLGLPPALFPAACWVYVSILHIRWKEVELLAVAEPLISLCRRERSDLCEIYIRLLAATACRDHNHIDRARRHIDEAIALAKPLGFIEPFIEYRRGLTSMLDARMKALWPEAHKAVRSRMPRFFEGWSAVYNAVWDSPIATGLTPREYEACGLFVRGMKAAEIARRMGISKNSVKKYISSAYGKLSVDEKKKLQPLIKP